VLLPLVNGTEEGLSRERMREWRKSVREGQMGQRKTTHRAEVMKEIPCAFLSFF
jgi:hypothetical protein